MEIRVSVNVFRRTRIPHSCPRFDRIFRKLLESSKIKSFAGSPGIMLGITHSGGESKI